MTDGDDRPLGSPTTDQVLKATLELTGGSYCGPGNLAQERTNVAIARCRIASPPFARGFVVAGADPGSLAQSPCGAKSPHVHTDFDEEFSRR